MKKYLDPTKIHVGLIRYAGHYHPVNALAQERWAALLAIIKPGVPADEMLPLREKREAQKRARKHGYALHFFEKGLGR